MRFNLLFFLIVLSHLAFGQAVCQGTLGDPVKNINFGSGGATFGAPLTSTTTNYRYVTGTPEDGEYTIAKNTFGMHNSTTGWHQISNHTPNDPDGYMMVVNASTTPGIFYQTTITDLCPGTTYEFAAWIINLLNYSGNKPNITFGIYDLQGNQLSIPYNTNNIPESSTPTWKQYGLVFTTPNGVTDIVLKMINNGPGGTGNDLALDDITFRPCGPVMNPSIDLASTQSGICLGVAKTFNLSVNVSTGTYADPAYQWQTNTGAGWIDLPGETNTGTIFSSANKPAGTYQFRLLAAERSNINSASCRIASSPLTINIYPIPNPIATSSGPVCVGGNAQFFVSEGTSFEWRKPNGDLFSTDKNPVLNQVTLADNGVYTVKISTNGCTNTSQTTLNVLPPPTATVNISSTSICESASVQLQAGGGTSYKWFPAEGLSNPNIANPLATPKKSTTYTVTVSNGACSATQTSTLNVIKNPVANAGPDQKIFKGKSVTLNGKIEGSKGDVQYFWTPADYLDDPTKLNPVATPPADITYTLHVTSLTGCQPNSDQVFIKVYPEIIIPNSFTPNNDGVNDTWDIPAAAAFPNMQLKVINRYGQVVYQNNGLFKAWDGKYNGKELPAAPYYYTLYFNEDFKTYSGWVMLIR